MAVGNMKLALPTAHLQLGQQVPPGAVLLDLHTTDVESDGGHGRGKPSTRIRAKTKKDPELHFAPATHPATPLPQQTEHTPKTQ